MPVSDAIEDVCAAESRFGRGGGPRHPQCGRAKPCLSAPARRGGRSYDDEPIPRKKVGPIKARGSPLSYWGPGARQYPMRYLGRAPCGTWLTLAGGAILGAMALRRALIWCELSMSRPPRPPIGRRSTTSIPRSIPSRSLFLNSENVGQARIVASEEMYRSPSPTTVRGNNASRANNVRSSTERA